VRHQLERGDRELTECVAQRIDRMAVPRGDRGAEPEQHEPADEEQRATEADERAEPHRRFLA
jgi:hypothetical protein